VKRIIKKRERWRAAAGDTKIKAVTPEKSKPEGSTEKHGIDKQRRTENILEVFHQGHSSILGYLEKNSFS
jgi:hypothetical protein